MNHPVLRSLLALVLLTHAPLGCKPRPAEPAAQGEQAATVEMRIGGETFNLEIADSEDERKQGLMKRGFMPADHGMLFVFEDEDEQSFWMKDTFIPLDILYLDASGRVVSVKAMKPRDKRGVPSDGPAMYAVEMNAGAATRAGVGVGDVLMIPEQARKPAAAE